jgi:hypothetical protein
LSKGKKEEEESFFNVCMRSVFWIIMLVSFTCQSSAFC